MNKVHSLCTQATIICREYGGYAQEKNARSQLVRIDCNVTRGNRRR